MERVAHVEHLALVLIRLELEKGPRDLFTDVLVQREYTVFLVKLCEDLTVIVNLPLSGENFQADNHVVNGRIKLFALFFTENDLSQLVGLLFEQISNEPIVELFLKLLKLAAFLTSLHRLASLVQLEVLAQLLE